jgi:hypothetical protein
MIHFIFQTNQFIPKRFSAYTFACFILVRPEHRDNKPLIEHEKVHVHQFWRTLGLNGMFYLFSKKKKLEYEVEAYKKQLSIEKNPEYAKELFALWLSTNYNLDITKEEAKRMLS